MKKFKSNSDIIKMFRETFDVPTLCAEIAERAEEQAPYGIHIVKVIKAGVEYSTYGKEFFYVKFKEGAQVIESKTFIENPRALDEAILLARDLFPERQINSYAGLKAFRLTDADKKKEWVIDFTSDGIWDEVKVLSVV